MKTINCIGCGRLGRAILKLIVKNQVAEINEVVNQSLQAAEAATKFVGQGKAVGSLDELSPADIYFITTRDDTIQHVCEELVRKNLLKPHSIVIHFSGSLTSDVLLSARDAGCFIASVHPVKSFANAEAAVNHFSGTFMAIEGDIEAMPTLNEIIKGIGGIAFSIKKENKRQYHAGMVIANNYLTTLHHQAVKNLQESGVEEGIAKKLVSMLMGDSLNNVNKFDHKTALTGPIQRGDAVTVKGHMEAIGHDPISKAIYAALGKGTLLLTSHELSVINKLERVLSNEDEKNKNPAIKGFS
jgi:predicted short-subunit dehydrogenase-like oxidoreductase (DUF2520 family)